MNNEYMYGTCVCVHTHVERIKNTGTCKLQITTNVRVPPVFIESHYLFSQTRTCET